MHSLTLINFLAKTSHRAPKINLPFLFPSSKLDNFFFLQEIKAAMSPSRDLGKDVFLSSPPSTYMAWILDCISQVWFEVSFLLL